MVTEQAVNTKPAIATEPQPHKPQLEPQRLTILAASDLHHHAQALDWFAAQATALMPDLVVYLGDFVTMQPASFVREALHELRALAPLVFVLPGNCDPREALFELDRASFDGMKHLHKQSAYAGGYRFAGLGMSTPTPGGATPLELPDAGFGSLLSPFLPADVWLLHNPLHGYCDAVQDQHVGSQSLRELYQAQEHKPLLVLSGHIHEAYGCEEDQGTVFVNPGALGERRAAYLRLEQRHIEVTLLEG